MGAGHPAQAHCRRGVRAVLEGLPPGSLALAAVSGGTDSLALAGALAACTRAGVPLAPEDFDLARVPEHLRVTFAALAVLGAVLLVVGSVAAWLILPRRRSVEGAGASA